MSNLCEIFTDGACSGNPGPAGIGIVIYKNGKIISQISKSIGDATNNIAEYTALIYALQEALILKLFDIKINVDSELMFYQINGRYQIKNDKLRILLDQVQQLMKGFQQVNLNCVPREKNKEADQLATQAIKNIQKKQVKMVALTSTDVGEESPSSKG